MKEAEVLAQQHARRKEEGEEERRRWRKRGARR